MSIKAIFFDNDGVLMDTEKIVFECNVEAFKILGVEYTLLDFQHTVFETHKGSSGFMKDQGVFHLKPKFELERDKIWNPRLQAGGHVLLGVVEVLTRLRGQGFILGLTTSAKREKFLMMSKDCELYDYFDFHLFREEVVDVKPHPEIYLKALEKAGVKRDEALVIEDAPRGIVSGKTAGIRVVALENEMVAGVDTSMADFHLQSIKELPALIARL